MNSTTLTESTLSFTGDICEDGTLTVIFFLLILAAGFVVRKLLDLATQSYKAKHKIEEGPKPNQLTENHWLEQTLVTPFVPTSLESFVASIFFAWFIMTIPMAITRFYESRWAHQLLAQQGPLNLLAHACGCKGLDINAIPYPIPASESPGAPPKKRGLLGLFRKKQKVSMDPDDDLVYSDDVDWFFGLHLAGGIMWLSAGAFQIFWARSGWSRDKRVRNYAHKMFGYCVAIPAFFCHIYMASRIAWRNPVHQRFMITCQYWATIFESMLLVVLGIMYRKKGRTDMHMVRMFFAFVQSIFGSGAVRLTAWILWLVGKFFAMPTRILIDRGACQTMAIDGYPQWGIGPQPMGSAYYCSVSVFVNLAVTDALILWLEWIFLCMPIAEFSKGDKLATRSKFRQLGYLMVVFTVLVILDAPDVVRNGIMLLYAGMIRLHSLRMWVAGFVEDVQQVPRGRRASMTERTSRVLRSSMLMLYQIPLEEELLREENGHMHED